MDVRLAHCHDKTILFASLAAGTRPEGAAANRSSGSGCCQGRLLTNASGTGAVERTDGIGLLTASIRSLCGSDRGKPLALLCSHFHGSCAAPSTMTAGVACAHTRSASSLTLGTCPEIVENNLLQGLPVRQQTMEILRTPDDDIAFLYRYAACIPSLQCAQPSPTAHPLGAACVHDQHQGRLLVQQLGRALCHPGRHRRQPRGAR